MTIELILIEYKWIIATLLLVLPWITHFLCILIPGKREEPILLSVNLFFSAMVSLVFCIYFADIIRTNDWKRVAKEADIVLLILAPYNVITSIRLAKKRLPLEQIPTFRIIQGSILISIVLLFFSWLSQRSHIFFFSRIPFSWFMVTVGIMLLIGYLGWLQIFGDGDQSED